MEPKTQSDSNGPPFFKSKVLDQSKLTLDGSKQQLEAAQSPMTRDEIYCVALLAFNVEDDGTLGILSSVFTLMFTVSSLLSGYLGDRYNRKLLMAGSLFIWGSSSLGSGLVNPDWPGAFWLFLTLQATIGIGVACFDTISPTIISDYFVGRRQTFVLAIFQSAMILGGGVGYMSASLISSVTGSWHYAFMFWPPIVFLAMIGLLFLKEPERGKAEGTTNLQTTSFIKDLTFPALFYRKSYSTLTLGSTATSFFVGGLAFWAPSFSAYALKVDNPDAETGRVGLIFGAIIISGGALGLGLGILLSKIFRKFKSIGDSKHAITCAIGALLSGPTAFVSLYIARYSSEAMWIAIFFCIMFLSVNLVLLQKITICVVIPSRRACATGLRFVVNNLLGVAIAPYVFGHLTDIFKDQMLNADPAHDPTDLENFVFRQNAALIMTASCTIGAFFFFMTALFVANDKKEAKKLAYALSDQANNDLLLSSVKKTSSPEIFQASGVTVTT